MGDGDRCGGGRITGIRDEKLPGENRQRVNIECTCSDHNGHPLKNLGKHMRELALTMMTDYSIFVHFSNLQQQWTPQI